MHRFLFVLSLFILSGTLSFSQAIEHSAWTNSFNTTRLNNKWKMQLDLQLMSSNEYKNLKNTVVRPLLVYILSPNNTIGLGYALNDTYTHTSAPNTSENGIVEQYIHTQSVKSITITHRLRLEQRFIETPGVVDFFTQRFRYYIRAIIPFAKQKSTFKQGIYGSIQNELFINLQNKSNLNNSMFDQNRAAAGLGYRFNSRFDMEAGYMNQFIKRSTNNLSNNVAQLTFYTRF